MKCHAIAMAIALRMSRACHLLMQMNDQMVSICYGVGFNNAANFNRRFPDVKGTAPTA